MAVDSKMTKWYLYSLESLKDHNLYIGISRDPRKRLGEHNRGKTKSTRNRRPFNLILKKLKSSL
ncbi:MAG: GIY-YIG nuclease family protein [Deltaproteobacteria bacterium]|nr:GIY-YIG nuclease family protein [Deltaproteobacteria bacterium]